RAELCSLPGSAFVPGQRHRHSEHQFIAARVSYEERRVRGILFYFLAQTINMRLKCVGCNLRIVTPDLVEQHIARYRFLSGSIEIAQHCGLLLGQPHLLSSWIDQEL